eukprot:COSAG01_NODE_5326_length_4332_cov_15.167730_3_plen_370_part_00
MESEGDGKRRKKRKPIAKIPLHSYARTLGRSVPSKRRTNTPYRRHYKQLVLDHTGDIPSATLAHHRDLDAADSLLMLHGGNLANKISDVADTVGTAAGLAGLASGATGIGAVATPFLEGLSGVANATSFVSGLFGDGGSDDDEPLTLEPVEDEPQPEAQMASAEGTPHPGILRQMIKVVDRVGQFAGLSRAEMLTTLTDLAETAVQSGMRLQDVSGNTVSYDEWYLNASPQRLQEALGMITPRTPLWRRTGESRQAAYVDPVGEARNAPFGSGKNPHDKFMDATHVYCEQRGSGLFDQHLTVPQVMVAAQNLRENPSAARMYRQRLVTPGQVADSRFVSSLEYTALNQARRPRRYTKVPRYRGTRRAKK